MNQEINDFLNRIQILLGMNSFTDDGGLMTTQEECSALYDEAAALRAKYFPSPAAHVTGWEEMDNSSAAIERDS